MHGENDVFCGYTTEDVERVRLLIPPGVKADPAVYTDVFGIKIDPSYCPSIAGLLGVVQNAAPFPDDGYLSDGIEFAAAAVALENSAGRSEFTSVELGAGWGPWTSFIGLSAARQGFSQINLVAFEADADRFEFLRRHLALNGLIGSNSPNKSKKEPFSVMLFRAAAWWRDETMFWPSVSGGMDAGMAVVSGGRPTQDYRGKASEFVEIEGVSIERALRDYSSIDFLHIDIQGGEMDLVSKSIDFLNDRVRFMFIGTHSRKIEGDLIELCMKAGWVLLRERPCQFYTQGVAPELTGLTYQDGGQFWLNKMQQRKSWYRRLHSKIRASLPG